MNSSKTSANKRAIAKTAIKCFQRFGVQRTSMKDIADMAGVSRQTIYRLFASKNELLESVADERIKVFGKTLVPSFSKFENLQEALVEGSIQSIKASLEDKIFAEILEKSGSHRFNLFLYGRSEEAQNHMKMLWGSILDRARETGELRPGITNEQAMEWIRNIHAMIVIRNDYDEDMQRSVLHKFLVPSVVNQDAILPPAS